MSTISKSKNISESEIRKACRNFDIPLPSAGHWIKLKFGKSVERSPLVVLHNGRDPEISLPILTNEEKPDYLNVPQKLTDPDKQILKAKEILTDKNNTSPYRFHGMVSCGDESLDIKVMPANVSRALRFMDTFIKAVKIRGHEILLRNCATYVIVFGYDLKISMRERAKRVPGKRELDFSTLEPTGLLYFKLDGYFGREWIDGTEKLEDQMLSIFQKLETESARKAKEREESRIYAESRLAVEKVKLDKIDKKQKELINFKELIQLSNRWEETNKIRRYIASLENNALGRAEISQELISWLAWANEKVDWYDPQIKKEDEMMKGIDRNTLILNES